MADDKGSSPPSQPSADPTYGRSEERRKIRNQQRRRPPPSMWTAPQSYIPPQDPANIANARLRDTYFRRVALPENVNGPKPTRGQRAANIAGGLLGTFVAAYLVLFYDFGRDGEHVFSPIRRMLKIDELNPFALSEEEKRRLAKRRSLEDAKARASKMDNAKLV